MTQAPLLDVLVLGAGPAGAATALELAGHCHVGMVGRAAPTGRVIGESLPAAARVMLAEMGLWPRFEAQQHRPAWSNASLWGDAQSVWRDALLDPHGAGWHLDRARFDDLLRTAAIERGAHWLGPSVLRAVQHEPTAAHPWRCELEGEGGRRSVGCRLLVDATGRAARVLRHTGVALHRADRLVCLYAWLPRAQPPALPGATLIESGPDGWWYSADLPDGTSVLAFHTDADMPQARACKTGADLLALAQQTQLVGQRCAHLTPQQVAVAGQSLGVAPANSQWAETAAGADWLAVGDAALAFDPLASQGLMNCLYTGLEGARVVRRHLAGDLQALMGWADRVRGITVAYARNLGQYYAMERRWADQPFWQRRLARPAASLLLAQADLVSILTN